MRELAALLDGAVDEEREDQERDRAERRHDTDDRVLASLGRRARANRRASRVPGAAAVAAARGLDGEAGHNVRSEVAVRRAERGVERRGRDLELLCQCVDGVLRDPGEELGLQEVNVARTRVITGDVHVKLVRLDLVGCIC